MKFPFYEHIGRQLKLSYKPTPAEKKRSYVFPGGDRIDIENVIEARASRHGNHTLTTDDGTTHVIPWGWICLSFPSESKVAPAEVIERGEESWSVPKE